jgi:hypothetical protein
LKTDKDGVAASKAEWQEHGSFPTSQLPFNDWKPITRNRTVSGPVIGLCLLDPRMRPMPHRRAIMMILRMETIYDLVHPLRAIYNSIDHEFILAYQEQTCRRC